MDTLRITVLILSLIATVTGHNITDILSEFPQYSVFNNYLSQTKLDDDINIRQTVTVLVLNNDDVTNLVANQSLPAVKTALSIHVLLDYFDIQKLLKIGGGTQNTTTLYQTTGDAAGMNGFVNITDLIGGKVGFGSADGAKLTALYTKSVKQIPYNISVLEISAPIIAPGIFPAPAPAPSMVNITSVMERAGCKTFARLITETGVLKIYEMAEPKGLTVFAPSDAAFKVAGLPNLTDLTNTELISLLMYHALSSYVPKPTLMMEKNLIDTLASTDFAKFNMTARTTGDSVTLNSDVDLSRVESTLLDSVPLSIFRIDNVLLPPLFFNKSSFPAAGPAPETSEPPAPTPTSSSTPVAPSLAPVERTSPIVSPPAPSIPSILPHGDGPAPADSPAADKGKSDSSAAGGTKARVFFLALVTVSISGIMSSIIG